MTTHTKNTPLNAIVDLYIRVSTQEQAIEGYSIGEQEERLRSYCKAMGYEIYKVHIDAGISGASLDRPGIKNLINDVQSGRISKILAWKLDRLSRSQKDTLILLEDVFLANNCDFISLMESFDTSTPFGRAIVGILAAFAQLERENIKERTYMGRQARTREGYFNGSHAPLGYSFEPGTNKLIVNQYEASIVKEVFDLFLSGKSIASIYRHTDEKYGNSSYTWNNNTAVTRILSNQTYIGKVTLGDLCCDGIHQSIISPTTFNKANAMLSHNRTHSKRTYEFKAGKYKADSLLTGLLYCGDCGARMTSRKISNKTRRYVCHSVARTNKAMIKSDHCTNRLHPFTSEQLEEIIIGEINKVALDRALFDSLVAESVKQDSSSTEVYEERLVDINKQIQRLLNLYQTGVIGMDDISNNLTSLRAEKEKLEKIIKQFTPPPQPLSPDDAWNAFNSFIDIANGDDLESLHRIIHSLINRIVILNDDITFFWSFC